MSASSNEQLRLSLQAQAEQTLREACAHSAEPPRPRSRAGKLSDDTLAVRRGSVRCDGYGNAQLSERDQAVLDRALRDFDLIARATDPAVFVVLYDRAGHIVRVNDGCQHTICGSETAENEMFWNEFSRPDNRLSLRQACESLGCSNSVCEWEGTCLSHDAHERTIRWRLSALEQAGDSFVLAVGTDLTIGKQMQTQLVSLDRLAAMGTLAAGMGHEINNPLAYLMMSLELAARSASRIDAEAHFQETRRLGELIGTAREGAERIREVVDELRTMARCEHHAVQAVDVCAVLDSCVQIAGNEIRHRAQLVKEYSEVPLVKANRSRLGQVFLNLLLNAAQSIPEGHAAENVIRLIVREHDGYVVIEVHDSGAGIDPADKARLFNPFFTTKPLGEGIGLGLSVCQRIVSDLQGSIDVESEVDKGSMFRVSLRVTSGEQVEAERSKAALQASRDARTLRILIVDDEPHLGDTLAAMLEEHCVATVRSSRDALRLCAQHDYDLILCDVQMPTLSGQDLQRELKQLRPGFEDRMVFMTGGAFTDQAREFVATTKNRVLRKPFSFEDVLALIETHALGRDAQCQLIQVSEREVTGRSV